MSQSRNQYIEFMPGDKYPTAEKRITYDLNELDTAGYVIKNDEVIIDIDDLSRDVIDELIRRFEIDTEIRYTERGVHLYFKKPKGFRQKSSGIIPLGFEVEYKTKKNHWIKVKDKGVEREVLNRGKRQMLPEIFRSSSQYHELLGLSDGDQRNSALYKHKFAIISFPERHKILSFINEFIFDEPLSEKEFETVTRDEVSKDDSRFELEIARLIIRELGITLYNKEYYIRDDKGNYDRIETDDLKRIIAIYADDVHSKVVEEIYKQIGLHCKVVTDDGKAFPIKFKNGFLLDGKFHDFNPSTFTPYHIDINYFEDAKPVEVVDEYLNFISHEDENFRKYIEEIIGYCFNTKPTFNQFFSKFFILYGTGSNGKGTFLRIVERIMGSRNCSFLSHAQLGNRFGLDNMIGRLVNISDDIPDKPFNDSILKMVKNISSSDPIQIDKKNSQPLRELVLTTTLIMSSNHIIKSFEKGESYKRRVVWLPIDRKPEKPDRHLIDKLTTPDALEYWISLAIKGYFRLYQNEKFTESVIIDKFNELYHHDNNNTLEFCAQLPTGEIVGRKQCEIKEKYEDWCFENDYNPLSKKVLKTTLEDCGFEFVKIGKKRLWRQADTGIRYDPFTGKLIKEENYIIA